MLTNDAIKEAVALLRPQEASESSSNEVENTEVNPGIPETPAQNVPRETLTPPVVDKPETDKLSKSWASISKKESDVRRQLKEIETQRATLDQAKAELEELRQLKMALATDPIPALDKHAGRDWYQKATERFVKDSSGQMPVEEKLARLEAQLERERTEKTKWFEDEWDKKTKQQQQATQYEQQASGYLTEMQKLIETDDRFELTRTTPNGSQAVIELVNGHLEKTGVLLSQEEAVTLVEEELEKQALAMLAAHKLRAKIAEIKHVKQSSPKANSGPKTLTDQLSASGTPAYPQNQHERIAEAAKLYRRLRSQGAS